MNKFFRFFLLAIAILVVLFTIFIFLFWPTISIFNYFGNIFTKRIESAESGICYPEYYRSGFGNIYFVNWPNNDLREFKKIKNADNSSFKAVDSCIAFDKNSVYLRGEPIKNLDNSSIKNVENKYCKSVYYLDKNGVYYLNGEVKLKLLQSADPKTFSYPEYIGEYDSCDSPYQFCYEDCTKSYGVDKDNVYFENKVLENVDRTSFKVFQYFGYSKDKNNIFYKDNIIEGADVDTFIVIKESSHRSFDSMDKNYYYSRGKRLLKPKPLQ